MIKKNENVENEKKIKKIKMIKIKKIRKKHKWKYWGMKEKMKKNKKKRKRQCAVYVAWRNSRFYYYCEYCAADESKFAKNEKNEVVLISRKVKRYRRCDVARLQKKWKLMKSKALNLWRGANPTIIFKECVQIRFTGSNKQGTLCCHKMALITCAKTGRVRTHIRELDFEALDILETFVQSVFLITRKAIPFKYGVHPLSWNVGQDLQRSVQESWILVPDDERKLTKKNKKEREWYAQKRGSCSGNRENHCIIRIFHVRLIQIGGGVLRKSVNTLATKKSNVMKIVMMTKRKKRILKQYLVGPVKKKVCRFTLADPNQQVKLVCYRKDADYKHVKIGRNCAHIRNLAL
ncbi:hypothetical protein RFI_29024 [Reticulomyxa filosa]|uniref:Uncharacterized protein n=1 Tax=Reticulomyxa filosa TaxID=46433 RepID=X6M5U1_RETFI|nr:hypothetical protein RFI_29024 [Reticulomyxa filosa]|eukprot:ETO08365.1 hypothetical protein RFI_29024 [Reticulomyxa filosa]